MTQGSDNIREGSEGVWGGVGSSPGPPMLHTKNYKRVLVHATHLLQGSDDSFVAAQPLGRRRLPLPLGLHTVSLLLVGLAGLRRPLLRRLVVRLLV